MPPRPGLPPGSRPASPLGSSPLVRLRSGKDRSLLRRHPWLYAGAISDEGIKLIERLPSGYPVQVCDAKGQFLAWACGSPHSSIRLRVWSFQQQAPDASLIRERVSRAFARRQRLLALSSARRMVFGEADGLPGLIVDQYAQQVVLQILSAGADYFRGHIVEAIHAQGIDAIYERSDAAGAKREGLAGGQAVLCGPEPEAMIEVHEHGLRFLVDVRHGHKTGFYIDQRDNRALVVELLRDMAAPRVLNCFCYTGGFSLAAWRAGAAEVISIDSSGAALEQARRQQSLNGFEQGGGRWWEANVFEALSALQSEGEQFDLIVLDPPKFAPSSQHVDRAARAYKEINLKALALLRPGGYLLSFSCSGAISLDLFQKILAGAVTDAGVDAQLLRRLAAGMDHPMSMAHPEGEYLKGLLLQRV
jgi:23S rRNA (cytosine1962-C5)-methyltransferase